MKKDWKVYAEKTFNNLKANSHKWRSSPNWDRAITRDYYIGVFDCGNPNPTGMISENAFHNKLNKIKTCLLYTSPSPRDPKTSRMPSSA